MRRHLFLVAGMVVGLILSVQLIYPYETALPYAQAFGEGVGHRKASELAASFQEEFEKSEVVFEAGTYSTKVKLSSLGASINSERMTSQLTDYPLWKRLLPLSLVWLRPEVDRLDVIVHGEQLESQAEAIAKQLTHDPTDASVAIKDGKLDIVASEPGYEVSASDINRAIVAGQYEVGVTKLSVLAKQVQPKRIDSDVAEATQVASQAIDKKLKIMVESKGEYAPDDATRASWVSITSEDNGIKVTANREAIGKYVSSLNKKVGVAAKPVHVTVVDGKEVERSGGLKGAALNEQQLVDAIAGSLVSADEPAEIRVSLVDVAPGVSYSRNYSHSQAGLRAYVAYMTSTQNVRIVVQQLDGNGWSASGRSGESIPSASTYKLFVMMRVFDDINSGKLKWNTPMLDTTVGGCFERTIVPSTNPCAEEWIRRYGRVELTNYIHSRGFSKGTGFTFSDAAHTTAGDLAKYLIGLHNGTLITGKSRDMLLEKMGRQLYRYGIPTGTKGWTQDKVGFLWDYIHDAGIVHNPKGTYILVVMTKGLSYGFIANVARQVDSILFE